MRYPSLLRCKPPNSPRGPAAASPVLLSPRHSFAVLCVALIFLAMPPSVSSLAAQEPQPTQKAVLRIGYAVLPPHVLPAPADNPQAPPSGAAVDFFLNHIAPRMNVQPEFVGPFPLARLLYDFDRRQLDAVIMLIRSPEREKRFAFPSLPFWKMSGALALRNEHPLLSVHSLTQLEGMRIGYTRDAWLPAFFTNSSVHFDFASGPDASLLSLQKLANGRVDAVFGPDRCWLECALITRGLTDSVRLVDLPDSSGALYTAFRKSIPRSILASYESALQEAQGHVNYADLKDRAMEQFLGTTPKVYPHVHHAETESAPPAQN
ncbi:substrate-binding periplasmic protein [Desulfovibrio psychrotolerans]|uniref:ABC transporter substrate-binding protein n=1 Tax=Desulfovibrio psychrotolerans TaxID=415242 RepID=A0A7J0BQT1_9BACT|nr:transporter substrate-binding domain-containing protein [Desulfovibrio psychrotolerans]GFM36030.1 hypothetical protein DSM19430T_07140 [Desulfovibrio psychrotolerans]